MRHRRRRPRPTRQKTDRAVVDQQRPVSVRTRQDGPGDRPHDVVREHVESLAGRPRGHDRSQERAGERGRRVGVGGPVRPRKIGHDRRQQAAQIITSGQTMPCHAIARRHPEERPFAADEGRHRGRRRPRLAVPPRIREPGQRSRRRRLPEQAGMVLPQPQQVRGHLATLRHVEVVLRAGRRGHARQSVERGAVVRLGFRHASQVLQRPTAKAAQLGRHVRRRVRAALGQRAIVMAERLFEILIAGPRQTAEHVGHQLRPETTAESTVVLGGVEERTRFVRLPQFHMHARQALPAFGDQVGRLQHVRQLDAPGVRLPRSDGVGAQLGQFAARAVQIPFLVPARPRRDLVRRAGEGLRCAREFTLSTEQVGRRDLEVGANVPFRGDFPDARPQDVDARQRAVRQGRSSQIAAEAHHVREEGDLVLRNVDARNPLLRHRQQRFRPRVVADEAVVLGEETGEIRVVLLVSVDLDPLAGLRQIDRRRIGPTEQALVVRDVHHGARNHGRIPLRPGDPQRPQVEVERLIEVADRRGEAGRHAEIHGLDTRQPRPGRAGRHVPIHRVRRTGFAAGGQDFTELLPRPEFFVDAAGEPGVGDGHHRSVQRVVEMTTVTEHDGDLPPDPAFEPWPADGRRLVELGEKQVRRFLVVAEPVSPGGANDHVVGAVERFQRGNMGFQIRHVRRDAAPTERSQRAPERSGGALGIIARRSRGQNSSVDAPADF